MTQQKPAKTTIAANARIGVKHTPPKQGEETVTFDFDSPDSFIGIERSHP